MISAQTVFALTTANILNAPSQMMTPTGMYVMKYGTNGMTTIQKIFIMIMTITGMIIITMETGVIITMVIIITIIMVKKNEQNQLTKNQIGFIIGKLIYDGRAKLKIGYFIT